MVTSVTSGVSKLSRKKVGHQGVEDEAVNEEGEDNAVRDEEREDVSVVLKEVGGRS